uniref:Uncharacterized protein n=1 Tax=Fagus sylvatica TaxID=28930 RepID=A0A2N9IPT1_FAGSY
MRAENGGIRLRWLVGESNLGWKRLRSTLIGHRGAEHAIKSHNEIRPDRGHSRLGSKELRWVLMRPWETEKVRIVEAEEMLDVAEVHYMCFEFLSSACGLMKPRHGRAKPWGCREDPRRGRGGLLPPMDVPSMPRKFTVRPDLCRGGL